MTQPIPALLVLSLMASAPVFVNAEEVCDCAVKMGSCNARLAVTPISQRNGIYGAAVKVITDSASCARVDYYVEHTPTVSFLRHGGSAEENVTGSLRPMTSDMFTVDACRICEVRTVTPPSGDESLAERLFGEAISSDEPFDPSQKAARISEFEARQARSFDAQALQSTINAVQQIQQIQNRQDTEQAYKSGLQNHNPGVGYEYGDSSVKPLPPLNPSPSK